MKKYALKIYYIKKRIEFTTQDSAKDIDVASWRSSNLGALNNMHQNELEINSLDVDSPHCSWQIGPRLKSCALTVAPPP